MLELAHDAWRGVRFGEATHPGPAGSRASKRKRKESENSAVSFDGLAALLQPLLQSVLEKLIGDLLSSVNENGIGTLLGSLVSGARLAKPKKPKKPKTRKQVTALGAPAVNKPPAPPAPGPDKGKGKGKGKAAKEVVDATQGTWTEVKSKREAFPRPGLCVVKIGTLL